MKKKNEFIYIVLILLLLLISGCENGSENDSENNEIIDDPVSWKFAVIGDTHVGYNSETISEIIPHFIEDNIDLVLICGDIVHGGKRATSDELEDELEMWQKIFQPLYDKGIGVYPVRGNHENDAENNIMVWNKIFSGSRSLPQNGPAGETNLTYSFNHKNALFIGLDTYVNIHRVNQTWLDQELIVNQQPHVFVFGHEAAFKVFHSDCLDDYPSKRDVFWKSLTDGGVKTYFCGHDHFFDLTQIEDGDGNSENNIYQCVVGGGGGFLMPKYRHNGENSSYLINAKYHNMEHGYVLVEVSGETSTDLDVKITWKERSVEGDIVKYIATSDVVNYKVVQ